MIKLEALRVFVTVAEVGNIKQAAEQVCRTASAVSMTLKQLEEELGEALFESDRKNKLTTFGAFVLQTGKLQVRNYDKAISTIHAFANNQIGNLSLACVPSVAANLIPSLLSSFIKDRPGVEVELFDIDSRNVRLMLETGQADIGLAGEPSSDALVRFEPLFRDQFKVICASSSALAQSKNPISWADMKNQTLILNGASEKIQSPHYKALATNASMTVRNVTSLIALAKIGSGITLLPALATTNLPDGVIALNLEDDSIERVVGFIERRNVTLSPVATVFRQFIIDHIPALIEELGLKKIEN